MIIGREYCSTPATKYYMCIVFFHYEATMLLRKILEIEVCSNKSVIYTSKTRKTHIFRLVLISNFTGMHCFSIFSHPTLFTIYLTTMYYLCASSFSAIKP